MIQTGKPDPSKDTTEFEGDLIIEYKQARLIHAIKPIKIPLLLSVNDQTKKVVQCGANVGFSAILSNIYREIASLKNDEIKALRDDLTSTQGEVKINTDDVRDPHTGLTSHETRIAALESSIQSPNCDFGVIEPITGECSGFDCTGKTVGNSVQGLGPVTTRECVQDGNGPTTAWEHTTSPQEQCNHTCTAADGATQRRCPRGQYYECSGNSNFSICLCKTPTTY